MNFWPGEASTSNDTERPTATSALYCSGTVSCTRSGLVRITEATFVPRVHVIADRDQPLADDAGKRRLHDGVGQRLLREHDAGARGEQRLILLHRAVSRDVELPPRHFRLRALLIEVGLRQQLLLEQHLRAIEVAVARVSCARALATSGTRSISNSALSPDTPSAFLRSPERLAAFSAAEPEAAFELRGVGLGFRCLRLRFGGRDANQIGAFGDARATLDRRRDHAALDLGRHFRFFLRGERAGDFEEARDRLLGRGSDGHADRRRSGGLCRATRPSRCRNRRT